jgi:phosphatidylinositol alpha-1,6-mannosyltransferase
LYIAIRISLWSDSHYPEVVSHSPDVTRRPRVLVVTPDYPPAPGGIQRLVHRVVSNWSRLQPVVMTPSAPGAEAFDRSEAVPVRRLGVPRRLGHRAAMAALNARIVAEGPRVRPAVVLTAHIVTGPSAWAVARLTRAPLAVYVHAHEVADRRGLARAILGRASLTIAVSRYTASLAYSCGADPDRTRRIPPGVDLPAQPGSPKGGERAVVVTVARLEDRYKGHDVMIRAIDRLRERVPNVLWVVVGDGSLRGEYEWAVGARRLGHHVRFVGNVDDRERDAWLARATAFAMPSRLPPGGGGEGFGIAYMEAAARGLPVVAGRAAGAVDAVQDGRTGLLVDPTDDRAVADAIGALLLDPERARALGAAGATWAQDFTWPLIARRVEDALLEVMDRA